MTELRRFTQHEIRVPDSTRPGKWIRAYEWQKESDTSLSVRGRSYKPDSTGWIDVPDDVARELSEGSAQWMTRTKAAGLGIQDVDDYAKPARGKKSTGD